MARHSSYDDGYEDDCGGGRIQFADPGGRSALRAGKRNLPCPTCGEPNKLTVRDVECGYQCDTCADSQERGW